MKKRIISAGMTAIMLGSVVSGCGQVSDQNEMNVPEEITTPEMPSTEMIATTLPDTTTESINTTVTTTTAITTAETTTANTTVTTTAEPSPEQLLDDEKKNSVAMLNYLAVLTQEINSTKNSRLFLEEAYASLINNTNPEKIDDLTESHMASLLDSIEKYRLISVKRERLQYIYEQNKAKALKAAIPNPVGVLGAAASLDLKRLAVSVVYMAVDSAVNYQNAKLENEQEFLMDGWELDDEEAQNLHESRKRAFLYMTDIVNEKKLPGSLALSEKAIDDFVTWKKKENVAQKIQFLESEEETYKAFGNYWLELASCYYKKEEYKKCLDSIEKYEELQTKIFRKDYYYAQALPIAIASANEVYKSNKEKYIAETERYLSELEKNTENNEWALRYFAANTYVDLYNKTSEKKYLESAYDILVNNVNQLVEEQIKLNDTYLDEVQEISLPKDPTKDSNNVSSDDKDKYKNQKKQIEAYNKELKKARKTELPHIYEPLEINSELLFAVSDKLNLTSTEKNNVDKILHYNGDRLFLTNSIERRYTLSPVDNAGVSKFEKDKFTIPVYLVSDRSKIVVTVNDGSGEIKYEDWGIQEVKRPSDAFDEFTVTYTGKGIKKYGWTPESVVCVEILDDDEITETLNFKVSRYKDNKLLPSTVEFEQVK